MTRYERIQTLLNTNLSPTILLIEDESYKHQRPGIESHFKVIVVSLQFKGLSRIKRHQIVNELLQDEFNRDLHALSMHLYTTEEWNQKTILPTTPNCKSQLKEK